ncbi:DNAJ domain-containing protein [Didymella exigua CBS 183.55]|uniref:DNAJ domain-containing protein n=1 Tax=Didymella exigua CBS 183.55 TaxID=1150837 RepID=A0A6A5RA72_9PLEO|nr:DNAJ domain-containing protein [Didymella exigua CBS 183.55]KAF1923944.1 DNAJ domain-containing protein [Didymella exigua CBS 183.55]
MADDIEAELAAAGKELDKDEEIERIRNVFSLNAYAVLDLQPGVPDADIKKAYRAKSLLIHPDKTPNPNAPDAFDRLKKAQTVLLDEKLRTRLDEDTADARMLLMRDRKLTADDAETRSPEFLAAWRDKTAWVIRDNELRRQRQMKAQMRDEGRQQRKDEEEAVDRKRKRDHDQAWEKSRDTRINSWRDYQQGKQPADGDAKKKKKKKVKALG